MSFVPSGYVTTTTPGLSPGVFVFTGVSHSYLVPSGRPVLLTLVPASGVPLWLTSWFGVLGCGSFPFAVPFASVLSTSSVVIAFVFTEVLSLTSASLILIVPVVESIVNGAPASTSQPVAFLVAVYVTSTGVDPSCLV